MLVLPDRNHSNSWAIRRNTTFLVVTRGKAGAEIEAQLAPENAAGAGAGPVAPVDAFVPDVSQQVQVLFHAYW